MSASQSLTSFSMNILFCSWASWMPVRGLAPVRLRSVRTGEASRRAEMAP